MSTPLAYRNGQLLPLSDLTLSFADAGFVFGATITDFCRTYKHKLFRWPDHLARLRRDCDACKIPLPYSDADLTAAAEELVAQNSKLIGEGDDLALLTFATPGPIGYMLPGQGEGPPWQANGPTTTVMHTFPLPRQRYKRFFTDGVTLAVAGVQPSYPNQIVPTTIKHRSRLHWWLAEQAVRDTVGSFHTAGAIPVLIDQNGSGADTPIGCILAVAGDEVIRPVSGSVLDSVSLKVVAELCEGVTLQFSETPLDYTALCRPTEQGEQGVLAWVSELLLVGSAFGLASVKAFVAPGSRREFSFAGPVYKALKMEWSEMVGLDIEKQMTG